MKRILYTLLSPQLFEKIFIYTTKNFETAQTAYIVSAYLYFNLLFIVFGLRKFIKTKYYYKKKCLSLKKKMVFDILFGH